MYDFFLNLFDFEYFLSHKQEHLVLKYFCEIRIEMVSLFEICQDILLVVVVVVVKDFIILYK